MGKLFTGTAWYYTCVSVAKRAVMLDGIFSELKILGSYEGQEHLGNWISNIHSVVLCAEKHARGTCSLLCNISSLDWRVSDQTDKISGSLLYVRLWRFCRGWRRRNPLWSPKLEIFAVNLPQLHSQSFSFYWIHLFCKDFFNAQSVWLSGWLSTFEPGSHGQDKNFLW